jgi:Skp family chaperone for outer membrane proteins
LLPAADTTIGILYVERVFEQSVAISSVRDELKTRAEKVQAAINQLNDEAEALKAELDIQPKNSPAHHATLEKIEVLRLRRKLFIERNQNALRALEVEQIKQAYGDMRKHLVTFCSDRGISLALLGSQSELGASSLQELNLELATHSVLYHAPYLDITDDFIVFFNDQAKVNPQ